jgi:hypothetical protein
VDESSIARLIPVAIDAAVPVVAETDGRQLAIGGLQFGSLADPVVVRIPPEKEHRKQRIVAVE